jgi:uncharacterized membrane protein (UPF0127 family)
MRRLRIENLSRPLSRPLSSTYCDTFFCRLRGLMFRQEIAPFDSLLLVENKESRLNSSIHMLFMNFDIAVIWLNSNYSVVDLRLAHRWQLSLFPSAPAMFTLELHPDRLSDFSIGDRLALENV